MAIIGIDLGTTNSLAVAYIDDHYEMIPNCYGEYLTPSVISINEGEIMIGKSAKHRLVTHPEKTASLFKRDMGSAKSRKLNDKTYLPEQLSAFIVKQLIDDAKNYLQEEIEEIVISVPAYFNEYQRDATKRIGALLGVKVERLINEPSAAALACHQGNDEDESFVVFDFGGGTLDVSFVDCFDNVVSICAIAGNNQLGGSDFDRMIAKDFCASNLITFDTMSQMHQESLLLQCERAKIELQERQESVIDFHKDGKDYHYVLNSEHLKQISYNIFEKIKRVIAEAANNSGFEDNEVDKMVLVGGSCHMPIINNFLSELMNIPLCEIKDMDQIVAMGLGTYIGIKQRKKRVCELVLTDICPFSLGIDVYNEIDPKKPLYNIIIPRNSVLPTSKTVCYYTREKGQTFISLSIYQGEAMYVHDNLLLANHIIEVPKNLKDHETISVSFSYDINSLLYVEVVVLSTRKQYQFAIGEHTVSENQIKTIKNTSLKLHAEPIVCDIREHFERIIVESPIPKQEYIKKIYIQFETLLNEYDHNLRKKVQLINKMKEFMNEMEKENKTCDFFGGYDNDDDDSKGWIS